MSAKQFFQRATVTAILAVAGGMAGCDRADPIDSELRRADLVLGSLTSGGYTPIASQDRKREDLQWVINRLTGKSVSGLPKSLSGKGVKDLPAAAREGVSQELPTLSVAPTQSEKPSQQASALLLVSRAQGGLGEMQSREQMEKESALLNQVAVLRSGIEEWTALSAQARGFESYDPARDIDALRQKIEARRQELATLSQQKSTMDASIAELTRQASEATAKADAERTREAEIRARMAGVSETERARLLDEATKVKRAGDTLEKNAANLLAQAAKEQPAAEVVQRRVELAQEQIRLSEANIAGLEDRASKGRAAAEQTRRAAGEAQQRISKLVADAKALRTNADGPASEAVRLFEQALAGAKKSQTLLGDAQSKGAASAAVGGFSQNIADVHAARSRGLFQLSLVLKSAATGEFALPEASTYGSDAEMFLSQSREARKAASEAYTEAMNAFERAGFKDRAEEVQKKLKALSDLFNDTMPAKAPEEPKAGEGEAPEGSAPKGGADEGGAGAATFDKAAVEAEVRAAMQTMIDTAKGGDAGALMTSVVFEDAQEKSFFDAAVPMAVAISSLNGAAKEKFGKELKDLVAESKVDAVKANPVLGMLAGGGGAMAGAGGGLGAISQASAADLTITPESAEKATVGVPNSGALSVEKRDGAWKVVIAKTGMLDSPTGGQLKMMLPMFAKATGALTAVSAGTREGKYADADAMLVDLSAKLMGAMGGMGGPGGSGGGGG